MSKETLRKAIAKHVREYLARGGVIEKVPKVIFCPANMQWARDRGLDYQYWDSLGSDIRAGDSYWLGNGGYLTKPAPTEE